MKIANVNFRNDLSPVILWQYLDAIKMKGMVGDEQAFMDNAVTEFWTGFNENILNLATCNEFGLSLWGRLLRIQRPIYTSGGISHVFNDEQYRLLLKARIYLLTFDGSAKSLNHFFKTLFPSALVDIQDNLDMTVTINFLSEITPDIEAVLKMHEIDPVTGEVVYTFLPRPSGVKYIINTDVDYTRVFGFEGMVDSDNNSVAGFGPDDDVFDPATSAGGTFLQ